MLHPGYDETFCISALEGQASGLPIITFNRSALTERVINSNLKDIAVIALQFSIFILKITGAYDADINPKKLLHPNVRKIAYDLHFIAI
jgi:glycosyltransferase involved in cell wall biosynthesis